jgi:uncharacterized YigZ family protein
MNIFKTVKQITEASVKIQRSEFIAFLYPVSETSQIREIIAEHNNKYKDATHNCYAYILGKKQETQYYSDQGEPSGTAGKPILNALLKYNLTNTLAIVTRYFGGVKLGVRGLINAYSEATETVIVSADIIDYIELTGIRIECDYSTLDNIKHLFRQYDVTVNPIGFSDKVTAELAFNLIYLPEISQALDDLKIKKQLRVIS